MSEITCLIMLIAKKGEDVYKWNYKLFIWIIDFVVKLLKLDTYVWSGPGTLPAPFEEPSDEEMRRIESGEAIMTTPSGDLGVYIDETRKEILQTNLTSLYHWCYDLTKEQPNPTDSFKYELIMEMAKCLNFDPDPLKNRRIELKKQQGI